MEGRFTFHVHSIAWTLSSHPLTLLQLHEQGKTDQAKADLARLSKIRAEREAAQARRKAEAEGSSLQRL